MKRLGPLFSSLSQAIQHASDIGALRVPRKPCPRPSPQGPLLEKPIPCTPPQICLFQLETCRRFLSRIAFSLCLLTPAILWAGPFSSSPPAKDAGALTPGAPHGALRLPFLAQQEISAEEEPLPGKGSLQVPPPAEIPTVEKGTLSLSLRECLALALDNNLDIAIARYDPQSAETQIAEAKSAFHPIATFIGDKGRNGQPQSSRFRFFGRRDISTRETDTTDMNWGLKQKFASGTEYDLKFNMTRQIDNPFSRRFITKKDPRTGNPTIDPATGQPQQFPLGLQPEFPGDLSLTFTQHLLRNLGYDVNRNEILVAQNKKEMSKSDFRDKVEQIVQTIEKTYWDLVFSIDDLKVKQQSLDLAKDLLERNKIQVRVGTMAPIEITEAQAQVAKREEDIIEAEKQVRDMEDRLRKLINLPNNPLSEEIRVVPLDKPAFEIQEISLNESIQQALDNRSDYRRAKLGLTNDHLELKATKNRLLPLFDLTANYGNSSLEGGFRDSLADMFDRSNHRWNFGINVEIPLGNQAAQSRYTRARLETERTMAEIKNLEQGIILEVKEAIRAVQSNMKRVEVTRVSSQLQRERLAAEEKRFSVGLSTSRDVLEDQEQLTEAQSREIQAIIDYNKSLVDLERKRGTLLSKRKVSLF